MQLGEIYGDVHDSDVTTTNFLKATQLALQSGCTSSLLMPLLL